MIRGVRAAILGLAAAACAAPPERAPVPASALARAPAIAAPGTRVYESADPARPRITTLIVETLPSDRDGRSWIRVDARADGARVFGYEVLTAGGVPLAADGSVEVARWVLYPAGGPPVETVDAHDGSARLPMAAPPDWVPRFAPDSATVSFLGRTFLQADGLAEAGAWPRSSARRLALDDQVQVGTGRQFRDDGTGRHGRDFRWVPFTPLDYSTMVSAGFNLFPVVRNDIERAGTLPAFHVAAEGWDLAPEMPLRGNYRGAVLFADEPAVHVLGAVRARDAVDAEEIVEAIAAQTRRALEGNGKYGRGHLATRIREDGFAYGAVRQPPYPVWEAVASAAWYELAAGADGWILEARLRPAEFAGAVREGTGVEFPADPASCVRFHLSLIRGAARRFERPWGVSVYGQTDPQAADLLFPAAYDAGATYFWMWTSDGDHHVPYARQLDLARGLREHERMHPRDSALARTRAAGTALVVPWSYALDEFTFGEPGHPASLWRQPALPLDAVNRSGTPHREVLRAAMQEAVRLLERDEAFDVLFLRDGESASGYARVVRVDGRGQVTR